MRIPIIYNVKNRIQKESSNIVYNEKKDIDRIIFHSLSNTSYFDHLMPLGDHLLLHIYFSSIVYSQYEEIYCFVDSAINFCTLTKNAFYLDYLYYKDVINYSNFVISINKKYFINLELLRLLEKNDSVYYGGGKFNINYKSHLNENPNSDNMISVRFKVMK
ncbi:MAG: hypothetical protein IRZ03_18950 [Acidobacterium ailaaui]|nr:hypothetical protein [Pseudacidobacterium ailaaui]